jgi:ribosomal protein S17E
VKVGENSEELKQHYENPFTVDDHKKMVEKLLEVRGKCIICGYETDLYEEFLSNAWYQDLVDIITVTSSGFGGNLIELREVEEYIWTNFEPNILW